MGIIQENIKRQKFKADVDSSKLLNIIQSRFYLLQKRDRLIMSMYLENGLSYRQIALLLETSPSSISRRIKKIAYELTNGNFIVCMKMKHIFTPTELEIAKDYFIGGLSIKQLAQERKTSFYHIRELIKGISHTIDKIQKEKK